jgi:hypothetical protein
MEYTRDLGYCAAKYICRRDERAWFDAGGRIRADPFKRCSIQTGAPGPAWSTITSTR